MSQTIDAIFEHGVFKPLQKVQIKEHEKVKIVFTKQESIVKATKGMFHGLDDKIINEVAISPEFLPEET